MISLSPLRAVLDTNVIIAALLSKNPGSPTVELLQRWGNGEFTL
jgi:predicted nucleic acid-binding protein